MLKQGKTLETTTCGCCWPGRQQLPRTQPFLIERVAKFALGLIGGLFPMILNYLYSVSQYKKVPGESLFLQYAFWTTSGALLSFYLKFVCKNSLINYLIPYLKINCDRPVDPIKEKLERVADNLRGCLVDVFVFGIATLFTLNTDIHPQGFGGSLDIAKIIDGVPHREVNLSSIVLLIVFGHYIERLHFEIVEAKASPIFWTKIFHHSLTLLLISACLTTGYTGIGIPVILTHSMAGIFLCLSRVLNETVFTDIFQLNYIFVIVTWFYSRVWIFSSEIIVPLGKGLFGQTELITQFFCLHLMLFFCLLLLLSFNLYWGTQLTKTGLDKRIIRLHLEPEPKL